MRGCGISSTRGLWNLVSGKKRLPGFLSPADLLYATCEDCYCSLVWVRHTEQHYFISNCCLMTYAAFPVNTRAQVFHVKCYETNLENVIPFPRHLVTPEAS